MVCPLGSGRMEALTRLFVAGNIQQTASEEVGCHKLAAQYIQKELREADEANLIDEEDMHVFGLRPLTDPLHLVCCNACKKPIKASQYVAHSELCKSLNSAEEIVLEVNDGIVHKKRPRKERKKSLTAYSNKPVSVRKKAKPELLDNGFAASSCCSEELHSAVSFPKDKKISSHLNVATVRNSSMVSPGPVDCSEGAFLYQEEHSNMLIAGKRPLVADFGTVNGVTKSWSANSREVIPFSGEEHQERSTAGSDNTGCHAVAVKIPIQVQKFCLKAEGNVPHPLATKMYYSQRQLRLRSALSYMYHEASCNESGNEFACPKVLRSNVMPAEILCHSNDSHLQINHQQEKARDHSFLLVEKPNLLQMVESGGCPPPINIASQSPVNNVLTHATIVNKGSNYNSNCFSFAGHSDKQLQPMQQTEGNSAAVQNY
ncbi:putative ethylene-responsive transcription factor-like [Capsicum annuum]|uniref:SAGA-associated factor 11 n=1 Tax=Capsicum annuum TaxID=4072 RepID=A0A1U8EEK8_CAPAN|nr:uncharacterized protein LOC107842421 isoform X1 [Capsicum annuum]XP_016541755.1 uncharacterized protein LOC107842421 isoform X1 [Capsicum annuum]KAF3619733.1 putative ethylene-responsive transcription factor-like [Capsicum annuum]KAF3636347.1 putative ethylene-responsive transcription factor-like [Capsicum annuum]PHT95047.1 hypothetical protein T459_02929 [Capsicum annuum]